MKRKMSLNSVHNNKVADYILTKMLEYPNVVEGVFAEIPSDWKCSTKANGSNPTKVDFAYAWLWEQLTKE